MGILLKMWYIGLAVRLRIERIRFETEIYMHKNNRKEKMYDKKGLLFFYEQEENVNPDWIDVEILRPGCPFRWLYAVYTIILKIVKLIFSGFQFQVIFIVSSHLLKGINRLFTHTHTHTHINVCARVRVCVCVRACVCVCVTTIQQK